MSGFVIGCIAWPSALVVLFALVGWQDRRDRIADERRNQPRPPQPVLQSWPDLDTDTTDALDLGFGCVDPSCGCDTARTLHHLRALPETKR